MNVNCMSLDDFKLMCQKLMSPIEIIEYIKWRQKFYEKNGSVDILITETDNNFHVSKPQKGETLIYQYLYEQYGDDMLTEDVTYIDLFRRYVSVLHEHIEMLSEANASYEIVKFLAHLFRDEIKCFTERVEKALIVSKQKKFEIVGTLRNSQSNYAVVFLATEQREVLTSEKLLQVIFEKQVVHRLLQVIVYWISDKQYKIDFVYWQGNGCI